FRTVVKSNGVWLIALVAILVTLGAACAKKSPSSNTNAASTKCNADQFGCVVYQPGQPIKLGTLLSISGNTAFLGTDSQHGAQLALDYLDGKMDGKLGTLDG